MSVFEEKLRQEVEANTAAMEAATVKIDELRAEVRAVRADNERLRETASYWMGWSDQSIGQPHDGEYVRGGNFHGSFVHDDANCRFCADRAALAASAAPGEERTEVSGSIFGGGMGYPDGRHRKDFAAPGEDG